MPVSVWLNNNENNLDIDGWRELIFQLRPVFGNIFDFRPDRLEIWSGSFFAESGGILISSTPLDSLGKDNPFDDLLRKALDNRLLIKFTGHMHKPVDAKSFMVCFLRSGDRWDMPHVFFDTEIGERDLLDILWNEKARRAYAYSLLDDIQRIRTRISNREHRIIDKIAVSRDFPDDESIKGPGTLLYYLAGAEHRIIKDQVRSYSYKQKEMKTKVSELNVSEAASRIYYDDEIRRMWQTDLEDVSIIPVGSLALISESETGIPKVLTKLETDVVKPFVDSIPTNFLDGILTNIKKSKEKNKTF